MSMRESIQTEKTANCFHFFFDGKFLFIDDDSETGIFCHLV